MRYFDVFCVFLQPQSPIVKLKKAMPTITRKIQLHLCTEGLSEEERKAQWKLLYRINDNLYRAANNISSKLYLDEHVSSMVRLKHAKYASLNSELLKAKKAENEEAIAELVARIAAMKSEMSAQEEAICSYATEMATRTLAGKFASEMELDIYGQILAEVKSVVFKNFSNDSKEVGQGIRSIRTYKKGMPIPFPWNKTIRLEAKKKESFSKQNAEEYDIYLNWYKSSRADKKAIHFQLYFGKDKSNNQQIVKRCLKLDDTCTEDYQLQTSSIQVRKGPNGTEFYLLLVVNIPQEKHTLNKKVVVGVDLGINVPAYVATNCTEERKAIGCREYFLDTRLAFHRRFRSLQKLKGTTGGRGRKKKLEPLERLREKEHNWVHTQNHLFSREVIKFALQVKAATIQMEDLSGFGKDEEGNVEDEKKFLQSNWSYFELQNMIKYKAAKVGIKVNFVNPVYTSQTCSCCGVRAPDNRESVHFVCHNPTCKMYGKEVHADYNAARNIANSNKIVKK